MEEVETALNRAGPTGLATPPATIDARTPEPLSNEAVPDSPSPPPDFFPETPMNGNVGADGNLEPLPPLPSLDSTLPLRVPEVGPPRSESPSSSEDYRRYRRRRRNYSPADAHSPRVPPPPRPYYPEEDPAKRIPAIPELGRVQWFDFKNKYVDEKQQYAIEVLVGEPKYYYQRQSEKDRGGLQGSDAGPELLLQRDAQASPNLPERIRINSWPLLAILANFVSEDWTLRPRVMLRPFKLIDFYEKEIREKLNDLEADWGDEASKPDADPEGGITAEDNDFFARSRKYGQDSDPRKILGKKLTDSVEALRDMRCLVQFIDQHIKPTKERLQNPATQKVKYTDLWYLYRLGDEVFETGRRGESKNEGEDEKLKRRHKTNQTMWKICSTGGGRRNLSAPAFGDESSPLGNKPHLFRVDCYYIDYNGIEYVACSKAFIIHPFEGEKDILSLDIFPLRFSQDAQREKQVAMERGKLFLEYKQWKQRQYRGPTLTRHPSGEPILGDSVPKNSEEVDSQVIVDFNEALEQNPSWFPEIGLYGNQPTKFRQFEETFPTITWKSRERRQVHDEQNDHVYNDEVIDNKWMISCIISDPFLERFQSASKVTEMRPENLFLLPARVFAYVLQKRKFAQLKLELLKEVKPQTEAFNSLKLPKRTKDTIQALVRSHFEKKQPLDEEFGDDGDEGEIDLVRGKGKGLIILLHGAPGVGKTSTAECMAAYSGKPLLPITCSDLGLTAENVESKLERIFRLASKWACVLLLDEADVFLARREVHDLERNSLVSGIVTKPYGCPKTNALLQEFLRALEYYAGLLFLTTNRVGAFDEAFKSRIHIKLYYPPLDFPQTRAIWREYLRRTIKNKNGTVVADENELIDWAMKHFEDTAGMRVNWNGRQIRNAFQTATALAEYQARYPSEPSRQARTSTRSVAKPASATIPDSSAGNRPIATLKPAHFDIVAQASLEFDQYFEETLGMDSREHAHRRAERADHWGVEPNPLYPSAPPPPQPYPNPMAAYPPPQTAARRSSVQSGSRAYGHAQQPGYSSSAMPPPPRPSQPHPPQQGRRELSRSRRGGGPPSQYGSDMGRAEAAPPTPRGMPQQGGYGGWPTAHPGQGRDDYYEDEEDAVENANEGWEKRGEGYGEDEYDD